MKSLEHLGDDLAREVAFAASHFFEISFSDFSSLSFSAFATIAWRVDLKLASEDSLFELICERIPSNWRFFDVLQFVRFEFFSVANLAKFIDFVCASFDCFMVSHWASLRASSFPSSPSSERSLLEGRVGFSVSLVPARRNHFAFGIEVWRECP
jgi:hypothetical protein